MDAITKLEPGAWRLPGETVRYRGSLHWVLYLKALPWAILGAAIILVSLSTDRFAAWWIAGAITLLAALLMILRAWFERWATEVLVTDRRVIYARGFIQRHTVEINMDKIESVDVDQGIMGRAFNYGDVRSEEPDRHLSHCVRSTVRLSSAMRLRRDSRRPAARPFLFGTPDPIVS